MKLIRERSIADRQEALNLAFLSFRRENDAVEGEEMNMANVEDIRNALKLLRPHYNDAKVSIICVLNIFRIVLEQSNFTWISYTTIYCIPMTVDRCASTDCGSKRRRKN